MHSESELVNLYVSAYGNEMVFEACLDSVLRQTHTNFRLYIFDDGFADGIHSIKKMVEGRNDSRVIYRANPIRYGVPANDIQIIEQIDSATKAMMLAGDVGLADDALEVLISLSGAHSVQVARSASQSHAFSQLTLNHSYRFDSPFRRSRVLREEEGVINCATILEKFYGHENLRGEFFLFSFYGTLFDGALIKKFAQGHRRFSFHGLEQYLSMSLALATNGIVFTPLTLLNDFVGQPRLGGHYRPENDISRLECLVACEDFLRENFFVLNYQGVDVDKLRQGQLEKASYYLENFRGFEGWVKEIMMSNRQT